MSDTAATRAVESGYDEEAAQKTSAARLSIIAAAFLIITRFKLLFADWRGYLIALFALVWIANQYMSIYDRLRLGIKTERIEGEIQEEVAESAKRNNNQ